MKKLFFLLNLFLALSANAQKIYSLINLTAPFNGISYAPGHNSKEYKPSIAKLNGSWCIDVFYKAKKISHKFSIEQQPMGYYFKLTDKFNIQAASLQLLSFNYSKFGETIDHLIFSYALQKNGRFKKGFLFNTKILFNYSAGLGVSLNRSKTYYQMQFANSSGGIATRDSYAGYYADHYRDGFGVFLRSTGGFDIFNKNGKRKLCFNVFYNQGLKDMAHFDIRYQYGYYNNPALQVDVPKQVLRTRGTNFGFSLGVPITIKK
jgi:hypothetical protein